MVAVARLSWRHALSRAVLGAGLVGLVACLDGPFARQNPNDPGANITITLVPSTDTVRPSQPVVVVQVVTDPPTIGYVPLWSVSPVGALTHVGDGVFAMGPAPGVPTPATITAEFQTRSVSVVIMRVP